jgi:hypothetical protein
MATYMRVFLHEAPATRSAVATLPRSAARGIVATALSRRGERKDCEMNALRATIPPQFHPRRLSAVATNCVPLSSPCHGREKLLQIMGTGLYSD